MNKKLFILHILNELLSVLAMAVALFWGAGRINWWPGWAAVLVWLVCFAAMDLLVLFRHPDLLAERALPPQGAKNWDKALVSTMRLVQLARYILAGLDQRYGWTGGFPLAAQLAGLTACLAGYGLFIWASASNPFFSQVVRIQSERGHTVATGGPYRAVRHPSYSGMIAFELGISSLLASVPALIAGAVCALLLVLRTVLEDRTLQAELPGYAEYARQVRYRLVPGLW